MSFRVPEFEAAGRNPRARWHASTLPSDALTTIAV